MAKTSGTSGGGPDYILMSYYVVHDLAIGLQTGADRTLYATWTWEQPHTEKFKLTWRYYTGDGVWFIGSENEETSLMRRSRARRLTPLLIGRVRRLLRITIFRHRGIRLNRRRPLWRWTQSINSRPVCPFMTKTLITSSSKWLRTTPQRLRLVERLL